MSRSWLECKVVFKLLTIVEKFISVTKLNTLYSLIILKLIMEKNSDYKENMAFKINKKNSIKNVQAY